MVMVVVVLRSELFWLLISGVGQATEQAGGRVRSQKARDSRACGCWRPTPTASTVVQSVGLRAP